MTKLSLNSIRGNELKELGYRKEKVNHFEKKSKSFLYIIDYEAYRNILMFRLLKTDTFNNTKCLKQIDIDNWISLSEFAFINMVKEIETEFKTLIN